MKPIVVISFFWIGLALSSCSTDFQIESEWKDIPVVYGYLSVQDTAHYLRVEKAFLEPGGNALEIAQIADSLYYPEDEVTVQLIRSETGQTYTLQRVDGNLEGYPRQEGPFAQAPNYLYKILSEDINLSGGETIEFILNRGDDLDVVSAETQVLEEVIPRTNSPANPIQFWPYNQFLSFSWNAGESAQLFDLRLFIHYREFPVGQPGNAEEVTLEWIIDRKILRDDDGQTRFSVDIRGDQFYQFMSDAIEGTREKERVFDSFDIQVGAGGQELVEIDRISQANAGITSSQTVPVYTNLSEGRGVFTSRYIALREGMRLEGAALDSLIEGIYTQDLNFIQP